MAAAFAGTAIAGFSQLAVGTDAGLSHGAPEQAVIGGGHTWGLIRPDILPLPMQGRAQAGTLGVEAIRYFVAHAAPPARRMARFTATRARWIFCELCPRLLALATAAAAA